MRLRSHWTILYCLVIVILRNHGALVRVDLDRMVKADIGDKVEMTWNVTLDMETASLFKDNYVQLVNWSLVEDVFQCQRGDSQVTQLSCVTQQPTESTLRISISNVKKTDAGCYFFSQESISSRQYTCLYVFQPPIVQINGTTEVLEGDAITLTCAARSQSLPTGLTRALIPEYVMVYTWTIKNPAHNHIMNESIVTIANTTNANNKATFTCQAIEAGSSMSPVNSNTVMLNISYAPGWARVMGVPTAPLVADIDNLTVTCLLSDQELGNPPSQVYHWTNTNSGMTYDTTDNELMVSPVNICDHDGTWQCWTENDIGPGHISSFVVRVVVKPECPTNLIVKGTTAVSIYLEWTAGNDGGAEQTFWLHVTEMASDTGFMVSEILDTTAGKGGLMTYTLTKTHGLVPDHSYYITLGAINYADSVTKPATAGAHTKAAPMFDEYSRIDYSANTATIIWPFTNQRSVTHVLIDVCISNTATCGATQNFSSPEIQQYNVALPEGAVKGYVITFNFYDGMAVVHSQKRHYSRDVMPEYPINLTVKGITAVSIYLEWTAGNDGGAEQTFWLLVNKIAAASGLMVSYILDTTDGEGGLMTYTLTKTHGIVPDTSFSVRVGAINRMGNVTNPEMATCHTKVEPGFEDDPLIEYTDNTAVITWPVKNLKSVTHVLIRACIPNTVTCGNIMNITAPDIQPYSVSLPVEANEYVFTFTFHDGVDVVHTQEYATDDSSIPKIVGGVVGGLVFVGIVAVLIALCRQRIIRARDAKDRHRSIAKGRASVQDLAQEQIVASIVRPTKYLETPCQPIKRAQLAVPSIDEITRADIAFDSVIKNGRYYDVWRGRMNEKDVIIKAVNDRSGTKYRSYLEGQRLAMTSVQDCDNTILCLGITGDHGLLVMDNAPERTLKELLQDIATTEGVNVDCDEVSHKATTFIYDTLTGVVAVHNLQAPALFYCLSSSHVLVTSNTRCKVSGFATADVVKAREKWEEQNKLERPIKWLSPEAIKLKHSTASDIWSLGILLWEILNHGKSPMEHLDDETARKQILDGYTLPKTPRCSNEIYGIISKCCSFKSSARPSATNVNISYQELNQYEEFADIAVRKSIS